MHIFSLLKNITIEPIFTIEWRKLKKMHTQIFFSQKKTTKELAPNQDVEKERDLDLRS
jgi:hypothetical protein